MALISNKLWNINDEQIKELVLQHPDKLTAHQFAGVTNFEWNEELYNKCWYLMNNLDKPIVITPKIMKDEFGYNGTTTHNRETLVKLLKNHKLSYDCQQIKQMNQQLKNQVRLVKDSH